MHTNRAPQEGPNLNYAQKYIKSATPPKIEELFFIAKIPPPQNTQTTKISVIYNSTQTIEKLKYILSRLNKVNFAPQAQPAAAVRLSETDRVDRTIVRLRRQRLDQLVSKTNPDAESLGNSGCAI